MPIGPPWAPIILLLVQLFHKTTTVDAFDHSQCIAPLGMESQSIIDEDITASSTFNQDNLAPHHGRLRLELNGGAWCPQKTVTPDLTEWLQIDLHTVHLITGVETQGRFGNGNGVEFAEQYVLEYWRPRLDKWIRYKNRTNGNDKLRGNINTYLEAKTDLEPALIASKIRFYPFSRHKRTVCMRVELYGCRWTEGVVSYSMPQGDKRNIPDWEFYDTTYDGNWDGERLTHGLGQLTDGEIGPDRFQEQFGNNRGWIGWKNDTRHPNEPIEIVFEFDRVRDFSSVHVYTNNQFERGVQVFAEASVSFSVGGRVYRGEPITYAYIEDHVMETPRNISIRLHHRIGRFVRLRLYFAARWILISEVRFESTQLHGNFSVEGAAENPIEEEKNEDHFFDNNFNQVGSTPISPYMGILVGILSVFLLLMVSVAAFIVFVQHRRFKQSPTRGGGDPAQIPDKAALYREPGDPEYAVPLQTAQFLAKPPPPPLPPPPLHHESYYAATEICNPPPLAMASTKGFIPPPPPLSTPPPVRLARQPRYVTTNPRTYIGP